MPITRAIDEQLKALLEGINALKNGQEETKEGIEKGLKDMQKSQEETKERIENIQEEIKNELKERVEKGQQEMQKVEEKIEKKVREEIGGILTSKLKKELKKSLETFTQRVEDLEKKLLAYGNTKNESKFVPVSSVPMPASPVSVKLSTYDGKTNWETLPDTKRLNLNSLYNAVDLRFGQKYFKDYARLQMRTRLQKTGESLQEYASEVERLANFPFSDHPATVREAISLQYFVDGLKDGEIQKAVRMADVQDLKSALLYALKGEAAKEASCRDSHSVRGARVTTHAPSGHLRSRCPRINKEDHNIKCWGCGTTGHVRSNCPRVNQDLRRTSVTESKKLCSNRKGSDENGDVHSKRPCSESSKNLSNSLRAEKKFGVIDPVVRQVTTPSTSALDPWSDESVRKDQLADPEIKPIIEFKESSDEKPSWQDIAPFHPTTKRYWALCDSLYLRNGVLYRKWESDVGKTFRWQLILPKTRISTVLKDMHGSPTGGHFGVMKTLQKVRKRFYWNNVRSDVEKCCRICDPCAARKGPRKRTREGLQLYNVGASFERIAFDSLGPLPRSSDGNNNILVVMDYFTKWPEAYPIPNQEASAVAEVLVQHWISRFGVPLQLHSDQGRNFDSAVCKRLCEILTIDETRTTVLHPQSDGMVERFNRTILNSLSLQLSSNQKDWDKKLPFFLLAYRSAVHETTGYSPSQMLFGRDLRLPADLLFS
ncbi:retrovirus-related Pol polyprotein from transposon 412 [Trichonephila clavipes]|nr:retrovirus-related Pol polyprotein from transposon 412 [Trichonephila clavipes]